MNKPELLETVIDGIALVGWKFSHNSFLLAVNAGDASTIPDRERLTDFTDGAMFVMHSYGHDGAYGVICKEWMADMKTAPRMRPLKVLRESVRSREL